MKLLSQIILKSKRHLSQLLFAFREYKSENLHVMTISTTYVEAEIVRAGLTMLPFLVIGFVIMVCVSSTTVMLSAIYFEQVSIHKVRVFHYFSVISSSGN